MVIWNDSLTFPSCLSTKTWNVTGTYRALLVISTMYIMISSISLMDVYLSTYNASNTISIHQTIMAVELKWTASVNANIEFLIQNAIINLVTKLISQWQILLAHLTYIRYPTKPNSMAENILPIWISFCVKYNIKHFGHGRWLSSMWVLIMRQLT